MAPSPSPCLDENEIVAFADGPAGDAAGAASGVAARVEEHVATCEACRRLLAEYTAMRPAAHATEPLSTLGAAVSSSGGDDEGHAERASMALRIAHAQAARRIGTVLCGKWVVERLLGIGGMAQVFRATHRNGRRVAIKMMRPELAVEPQLVARFLREGYVANKIEHAGAVVILDDDTSDDGVPFLVMELLEGRTLRERLDRDGPLAIGEALRIVDAALDVIAAAHERGIVHRDLKPENLFETTEGAIKVLDFGIARLREQVAAGNDKVTGTGVTMGTLGYMPPEQARGHSADVDARSDVWAIGATLFTLLTNTTLHAAPTANESLLLAMTTAPPPAATVAPALPPAVASLIDRALAFDKEARFPDARAMQRAVRAASTESAAAASTHVRSMPAAPARRRGGRVGWIAAAGVLAVGASVALRAVRTSTSTSSSTPTSTSTSTSSSTSTSTPTSTSAPTPTLLSDPARLALVALDAGAQPAAAVSTSRPRAHPRPPPAPPPPLADPLGSRR